MEYALLGFYYIFQSIFNMMMNLPISDGVTVGGVFIACIIIGTLLKFFVVDSDKSD